MAQAGYTPIQLYYSTTAAAQPSAGNLVDGELALNINDMKLYAKNSSGTVTLLASSSGASGSVTSVAMTVPSFLSVSGSPITTNGTLAVTLSGTALPVTNGGTGQTSYTDGQLLIGNTTGNTLTKATLTAGSGVSITNGGGSITISATGSGGTVTSVSWTGGIVSVANGTTTPAFTIAGTSGGVPYFSASNTWASSAALAANALVIGGGAGAAPATTTTGTGVLTALGVNVGSSGAFTTNNAANTFTALQTFSGSTSVAAAKLANAKEVCTVSATAATGTIAYDVTTQSVLYYTSNASANWTVNFRGSSGTSLNTLMATGESLTVAFLVTQGSTAYYNSAVQVDGSSVTPKWQGGTAPTSGNTSSIDVYAYTIIKTGSAAFTVLASQTKFA